MTLPVAFLNRPIAHRALHDIAAQRPENSRAAIAAAIAGNYGIEIDLQLSQDGVAMVFHDYDLGRLTSQTGAIARHTAAELAAIPLKHSDEGIPTLTEILNLVAGQVPMLIELKDQDGAMGANVGALEQATADALADYSGDVAVMSFNPHSVARMAELCPDIPRGIVTSAYLPQDWPTVPAATRDRLRGIPDLGRTQSCFISHEANDLSSSRVAEIKEAGLKVFCWTIRSADAEKGARRIVDNVTFEGYLA